MEVGENLPVIRPVETELVGTTDPASPPAALPGAYSRFESDVPDEDFHKIPPLHALFEDPEIASYLKAGAPAQTGFFSDHARSGLYFLACVLAVVLLYWLPPWQMFRTYRPPPIADTPKPAPYRPEAPLQARDRIRAINADIQAGDRLLPAFHKLRDFLAAAEGDGVAYPAELLAWAETETLVVMASNEIPPGTYDKTYPDRVFAALADNSPDPVPYRAGVAYAAILDARSGVDGDTDTETRILEVMAKLRGEHAALMDGSAEMLRLEAKHHIRAFPQAYQEGDPHLEYHWRRAGHAIQRLHALSPNGALSRDLDRERWRAVYKYFDFTLLTLDYDKLGRIKKITLDKRDYTRDAIRDKIQALND